MMPREKKECGEVLLSIYQSDYEAELSRSERIESKASTLFNYTSAIPTVLVGLFALGQTIRTQDVMPGESSFTSVYFVSILLFIISGYMSTLSLRVQYYPSVILARERTEIDSELASTALKLAKKRIGLLLDAITEIEDLNQQKAKRLHKAQLVMAFAVFLVMLSLALLILSTFWST